MFWERRSRRSPWPCPLGLADGGTGAGDGKAKTVVTCARTTFGGKITRVGMEAIGVRPDDSESGRILVVMLDPETVIKKGDAVANPTALAAGVHARFLVRACKSGDRRTLTARLILVPADPPAGTGDAKPTPPTEPKPTPPTTEPKPEQPKPPVEVCGQGETDAQLVVALRRLGHGADEVQRGCQGVAADGQRRHARAQERPGGLALGSEAGRLRPPRRRALPDRGNGARPAHRLPGGRCRAPRRSHRGRGRKPASPGDDGYRPSSALSAATSASSTATRSSSGSRASTGRGASSGGRVVDLAAEELRVALLLLARPPLEPHARASRSIRRSSVSSTSARPRTDAAARCAA